MRIKEEIIGFTLEVETEDDEEFLNYIRDFADIKGSLAPDVYKVYVE